MVDVLLSPLQPRSVNQRPALTCLENHRGFQQRRVGDEFHAPQFSLGFFDAGLQFRKTSFAVVVFQHIALLLGVGQCDALFGYRKTCFFQFALRGVPFTRQPLDEGQILLGPRQVLARKCDLAGQLVRLLYILTFAILLQIQACQLEGCFRFGNLLGVQQTLNADIFLGLGEIGVGSCDQHQPFTHFLLELRSIQPANHLALFDTLSLGNDLENLRTLGNLAGQDHVGTALNDAAGIHP